MKENNYKSLTYIRVFLSGTTVTNALILRESVPGGSGRTVRLFVRRTTFAAAAAVARSQQRRLVVSERIIRSFGGS